MIDYETFCRIHDCHDRQGLTIAQTARALSLHPETVAKWLARSRFEQRHSRPRSSVLDPFKPRITRLLDTHPYSAQQIFQRLREEGYRGGITILRDYVRRIRPTKLPVYLKLHFAPGECAQVDWGAFGTVAVGNTRRRLSFFVLVLAYSRQMYVEFTVSQTMEHFLACHEHAFAAFGGVPSKIMVDNLKSAVLQRLAGVAPVFNPRYLDFARHYGFAIAPCNVARGNEKGRVESGVGYVKKNFLRGLELADFSAIQAAAQVWLDTIANVRIHGETHQRPVDLFAKERPHMQPLNPHPYDVARTATTIASSQFRITLDTNTYSVPSQYAHRRLTLKAYPDRVCIYFDTELIARHNRRYSRREDIEDPEHAKALIARRSRAREQRLMLRFLALSPDAQAYFDGLEQKRLNARHHVRKILALSEIYPPDDVARAVSDGLAYEAFSAEYITNILETRARTLPEPGPLQLTRCHDLLDIDIPPPTSISTMEEIMTPSDLTRLDAQLDRLHLAHIQGHYQALATKAAQKQLSHLEYLAELVEGEATVRENRAIERRIKKARFPVLKTMEDFQWSWPKKINRPQIQNLFRLAFLATQTNVVLISTVGLGKTHISLAIGHAACIGGHSVLFTTAVDIINTLAAAQSAGRIKRDISRYLKPDLLIVDELGYLPIDKHGADLLFQIISQRYERAPMVITTNRAYKHWSQIFNNDSTLTSAILDRVLHHVDTVIIEGKSFRTKAEIDE